MRDLIAALVGARGIIALSLLTTLHFYRKRQQHLAKPKSIAAARSS